MEMSMKRITYAMEVEIGTVKHRYERTMLVRDGEKRGDVFVRECRIFADVEEAIGLSPFNRVIVPRHRILEEAIQ